jgi:hypothetical protein
MSAARELIDPDLFDRLSDRVMKDEGHDRDHAERVVDQALAFLKACADNPSLSLGPSTAVDAGWHAFLLHTREYASFCARVAGRFIHHAPADGDSSRAGSLRRTITAVRATGYELDDRLWGLPAECDGKPSCNTTCNHPCHDAE